MQQSPWKPVTNHGCRRVDGAGWHKMSASSQVTRMRCRHPSRTRHRRRWVPIPSRAPHFLGGPLPQRWLDHMVGTCARWTHAWHPFLFGLAATWGEAEWASRWRANQRSAPARVAFLGPTPPLIWPTQHHGRHCESGCAASAGGAVGSGRLSDLSAVCTAEGCDGGRLEGC